jgi:hypothetical protein
VVVQRTATKSTLAQRIDQAQRKPPAQKAADTLARLQLTAADLQDANTSGPKLPTSPKLAQVLLAVDATAKNLTAEEFVNALGDALSSKELSEGTLRSFMGDMLYEQSRAPDEGKAAIASWTRTDDDAIADSKSQPVFVPIEYPHCSDGVTLFEETVFPNSYFARRASEFPKNEQGWKALVQSQPCLEWSQGTGKLELSSDNPASKILDKLGASKEFKFYRGTFKEEAALATAWQALEDNKPAAALPLLEELAASPNKGMNKSLRAAVVIARNSLKAAPAPSDAALHQVAERLLDSYAAVLDKQDYRGLFVTPDSASAEMFSKGTVIEFNVPKDALQTLAKKDALFLGFEGEYLEAGFHGREALEVLFRSMASTRSAMPDGNIWQDASKGIWGRPGGQTTGSLTT